MLGLLWLASRRPEPLGMLLHLAASLLLGAQRGTETSHAAITMFGSDIVELFSVFVALL